MPSTSWPIIHAERRALYNDLLELTDEQWNTRSLCDGWTVREVLAHMTSTAKMTAPKFYLRFVAARFQFDPVTARGVGEELGDSPTATLENFKSRLQATAKPPGPIETMVGETIVHAADIRLPLGIQHEYSMDGMQRAASFYCKSNLIIGGRARAAGLTLRATDSDWRFGSGPEVTGPMLSLLMATAGRRVALDGLSGPGLKTLRERF
jgi:uncharacterized protein (TIGR03083 family)